MTCSWPTTTLAISSLTRIRASRSRATMAASSFDGVRASGFFGVSIAVFRVPGRLRRAGSARCSWSGWRDLLYSAESEACVGLDAVVDHPEGQRREVPDLAAL